MCCKKQTPKTLIERLGSPPDFGGVLVAFPFSFQWCGAFAVLFVVVLYLVFNVPGVSGLPYFMSDYERSVECYVLIEIYMHVHFVCDIQLNHLAFFYMYKMYTSDNEKIHHTR